VTRVASPHPDVRPATAGDAPALAAIQVGAQLALAALLPPGALAGVFLLAMINNGFDLLSANPFYKYLVTGLVIVMAVALSALSARVVVEGEAGHAATVPMDQRTDALCAASVAEISAPAVAIARARIP